MTEIFRKDEDDFVSLTTQVQQGLDVYPALKEKGAAFKSVPIQVLDVLPLDERLKSLQYINDQILETEKLVLSTSFLPSTNPPWC